MKNISGWTLSIQVSSKSTGILKGRLLRRTGVMGPLIQKRTILSYDAQLSSRTSSLVVSLYNGRFDLWGSVLHHWETDYYNVPLQTASPFPSCSFKVFSRRYMSIPQSTSTPTTFCAPCCCPRTLTIHSADRNSESSSWMFY